MSAEDPNLWAKVAAFAASALAGVTGWSWVHTHKRIDTAFAELKTKASEAELTLQRGNIKELFKQQREDREAVMAELRNTNELLGSIHTAVVRELGARPTRDEVDRMIERGKAA